MVTYSVQEEKEYLGNQKDQILVNDFKKEDHHVWQVKEIFRGSAQVKKMLLKV
jgi:hypothetical protein